MHHLLKNGIFFAALAGALGTAQAEPTYPALQGAGGTSVNQDQAAERRTLSERQAAERAARRAQFAALHAEVSSHDDDARDARNRAQRFLRFAEDQIKAASDTQRPRRRENDDIARARQAIAHGHRQGLRVALEGYAGHGARAEIARLEEVSRRLAGLVGQLEAFVATCRAELRGQTQLDYAEGTRVGDIRTWGDGVGVAFNRVTSWRFRTRREQSWARTRIERISTIQADIASASEALADIEACAGSLPG